MLRVPIPGAVSYTHLDVYKRQVLGYDASNLQQVVVWNSAPNGSDGGIWQGGGGPAADSAGIYLATGNGTFDANTGGTDFGDTILKMSPPSAGTLQVLSYFAPFDQAVPVSYTHLDVYKRQHQAPEGSWIPRPPHH